MEDALLAGLPGLPTLNPGASLPEWNVWFDDVYNLFETELVNAQNDPSCEGDVGDLQYTEYEPTVTRSGVLLQTLALGVSFSLVVWLDENGGNVILYKEGSCAEPLTENSVFTLRPPNEYGQPFVPDEGAQELYRNPNCPLCGLVFGDLNVNAEESVTLTGVDTGEIMIPAVGDPTFGTWFYRAIFTPTFTATVDYAQVCITNIQTASDTPVLTPKHGAIWFIAEQDSPTTMQVWAEGYGYSGADGTERGFTTQPNAFTVSIADYRAAGCILDCKIAVDSNLPQPFSVFVQDTQSTVTTTVSTLTGNIGEGSSAPVRLGHTSTDTVATLTGGANAPTLDARTINAAVRHTSRVNQALSLFVSQALFNGGATISYAEYTNDANTASMNYNFNRSQGTTVLDNSPNEYVGTLTNFGARTTLNGGAWRACCEPCGLFGTGSVRFDNIAPYNLNSPTTFEFKTKVVEGGLGGVALIGGNTGGNRYNISIRQGLLNIGFRFGSGVFTPPDNAGFLQYIIPPDLRDRCYHVFIYYDGTNDVNGWKIYLNGRLTPAVVENNTWAGGVIAAEDIFFFEDLSTLQFARIYDREITPGEIRLLYNGGVDLDPVTNVGIDPADIILWADARGTTSGTSLPDLSLNNNDGTLTGYSAEATAEGGGAWTC